MPSPRTVRQIIKEEIDDGFRNQSQFHDEQHRDILSLVRSNAESIRAIEDNTEQLIELHKEAQAIIKWSGKAGRLAKWVAIPLAGILFTYDWVSNTVTHMSIFK